MSQPQYPQHQQPGWGGPQQPGYGQPPFQPQPPKKSSAGKVIGFGCLGVVALFVLIGIVGALASSGGDSTDSSRDKAVAAPSTPKTEQSKEAPAEKAPVDEKKSQAEEFKACVAKSGTDTEKKAVQHVTKVTGADKQNDILDAAEVFTDFTGGFMSENQGDAKLIASAFTSCYESENGLVTVYGEDGDMIANANF
ncbi:hypothetical protein ACH40E_35935 [Streptomyces acidicola]|uniref:hypothetical protein n=1 Tax=Streptomyces acidicola TaxID=2596892 RepID=UPI0037B7B181